MTIRIMVGDCVERLQELEADSLDSAVTDAPYHLTSTVKRFGGENAAPAQSKGTGAYARASRGFMGQKWDGGDVAFRPETWRAVYRVLKPGAYLAAFAAPRNSHRMASAIEDAGFEIRDEIATLICSDYVTQAFLASLDPEQQQAFARCIHDSPFGGVLEWVFGSGFPKSNDAERDIAKLTCPREGRHYARVLPPEAERRPGDHVCPVTPQSAPWKGYGTALKPGREPIVIARKPLQGTVANNALTFGTGAINIDGCRVNPGEPIRGGGGLKGGASSRHAGWRREAHLSNEATAPHDLGRWPANIIHDGSEEVLAHFPDAPGQQANISATAPSEKTSVVYGKMNREGEASASRRYTENGATNFAAKPGQRRGDSGSAARFFYTAKPDAAERHAGCQGESSYILDESAPAHVREEVKRLLDGLA